MIEKYFDDSKQGFQKCIFMFSSTVQQYSWQDKQLSFFTRAFVEAVKSHQIDKVRYRNIMDYISDEFQENTTVKQTPVFVTQMHNTETFCVLNPSIKQLTYPVEDTTTIENHEGETKQLSLKSIVEKESQNYLSEERTTDLLNDIRIKLEGYQFRSDLLDLYEIDLAVFDSIERLPFREEIGE